MSIKNLIVSLLIFISINVSIGQTPNIRGNVYIDLKLGKLDCQLEITNISDIRNSNFILNKGLNLKFIKVDGTSIPYEFDYGRNVADAATFSDAMAYFIELDSITKDTKIELEYTGSFPTYSKDNSEKRSYDDQVTIAFKDEILRASSWTKWYPWFFNKDSNFLFSQVSYDLSIGTNDANYSIYINGNEPLKTKNYKVSSAKPFDLFLYVGNYDFTHLKNTCFLNSSLSNEQHKGLDATLSSINTFYNRVLDRSDTSKLYMAQIFKIGPEDEYYPEWALAEYPAIISELDKLPNKMNDSTYVIEHSFSFRTYAHEMAHKYWGIELKSNNEYFDFFSETLAEYFALCAMKNILGIEKYTEFLNKTYLADRALKAKITQIDKVEKPLNKFYCYYYYPMILVGMEQIVGEEKVIELFKTILEEPKISNLNFQYIEDLALSRGIISKSDWEKFNNEYVQTPNCLALVRERLISNTKQY